MSVWPECGVLEGNPVETTQQRWKYINETRPKSQKEETRTDKKIRSHGPQTRHEGECKHTYVLNKGTEGRGGVCAAVGSSHAKMHGQGEGRGRGRPLNNIYRYILRYKFYDPIDK